MPHGDIISVQASNDAARAALAHLEEAGALLGAAYVILGEPTALLHLRRGRWSMTNATTS